MNMYKAGRYNYYTYSTALPHSPLCPNLFPPRSLFNQSGSLPLALNLSFSPPPRQSPIFSCPFSTSLYSRSLLPSRPPNGVDKTGDKGQYKVGEVGRRGVRKKRKSKALSTECVCGRGKISERHSEKRIRMMCPV